MIILWHITVLIICMGVFIPYLRVNNIAAVKAAVITFSLSYCLFPAKILLI